MQTFGCGAWTGAEEVEDSTAAAVVFLIPLGLPKRPVNKPQKSSHTIFNHINYVYLAHALQLLTAMLLSIMNKDCKLSKYYYGNTIIIAYIITIIITFNN